MKNRFRTFAVSLLSGLLSLCFNPESGQAQKNQSYTLPAVGYDISLADNGSSVVSLTNSVVFWARNANGVARTVPLTSEIFKVEMKADGSVVYLLGLFDSTTLYRHDLATDATSLRSFEASPVDFKLSPDGAKVTVGMSNNVAIVSYTTFFEDGAPISLAGKSRAIAVSPDSAVAYLAVGAPTSSIIKVQLSTRQVIQQFRVRGAVETMVMSPSGEFIYAVVSRTLSSGKIVRSLAVINSKTRKVVASRTLQTSGTDTPVFDIEAGAHNIFVSSSQPFVVGSRKAGVIRLSVTKGGVGQPIVFAQVNAGANAIAYRESIHTLGMIDSTNPVVRFKKTPTS